VTTDKAISINTLNETNLFSYVPKWYKVQNGTSMFGADTLLTYDESRGNVLHECKLNTGKSEKLGKCLERLNAVVSGEDVERESS